MTLIKKLSFDDILIVPRNSVVNSRKDISLIKTFHFKNNKKWTGIPIVVSNMDTTGTFEMAKQCGMLKIMTCIHKYYSINEWIHFIKNNENILNYVAVSSGISTNDLYKMDCILNKSPNLNIICLDVANGYIPQFITIIKAIRKKYPAKIIIAGNVVTPERCLELYEAGVDIVKIGIGSGSVCLTRRQTGVGYPQASAVYDCKNKLSKEHYIMSDGGCKNPGDVCKAFAMGADFVMLGSMFSGHTECSGNIIKDGKCMFKLFYGMSSCHKMNKYDHGIDNYRSSEGKCIKVPFKGAVKNTIDDLLGGIRSHISYVGYQCISCYDYTKIVKIRTNIQLNPIYSNNHKKS